MLKVHILVPCSHCNGESYQPIGEAEDCQGHKYTRDAPCPMCEGSDRQSKRVSLANFDQLPRHPALRCGRP
jgi:DnaJ-class molecular chaperone